MKLKHAIFSLILLCASFVAFVAALLYFIEWCSYWVPVAPTLEGSSNDVKQQFWDNILVQLPKYLIPLIFSTLTFGLLIYFILFLRKNYSLIIMQQREAMEDKRKYKEKQEKEIRQKQIAELEKQLAELKKDDQ